MLVTEGLEWKHVYFVKGALPRGTRFKNAISDPPCAGWGLAFILPGEKRSTVFCPYSFKAYTVPNNCSEIELAEEPPEAFRPDNMRALLELKWEEFQTRGWQCDYDTCALVMRRLNWPVPAQIMTGGGEDTRKKGGKGTGSKLLKPVKAQSKRGKFLQWFIEGDGSRSVREAMAEFAMTRSNALSYLYMLQKDHGIGYELIGDVATISLPEGCTDPFDEVQPAPRSEAPTAEGVDGDDSWLD